MLYAKPTDKSKKLNAALQERKTLRQGNEKTGVSTEVEQAESKTE